jgi:hypothetical protein
MENRMIALLELTPHPDRSVAVLGGLLLLCCGVRWRLRWLQASPRTSDPWEAALNEAVQGDDAVPLCHRCLAPHDPQAHFCHDCGAAVGSYTNWLPFPQLFSVGHILRVGTDGRFKHSPLTISGFIFLSIAEYHLFAPIYWFLFFRGITPSSNGVRPAEHA